MNKKKAFILLTLLFTLGLQAQQLQRLDPEWREPTFYYWDTNWWDYYWQNYSFLAHNDCKTLNVFTHPIATADSRCELARPCYSDSTLRIIGVAAPVNFKIAVNCRDTSRANMLPEYFCLYTVGDSGEMQLLASAQWNNFTPQYEICTTVQCNYYFYPADSVGISREYTPVYEAYFDEPVDVSGLFYVSGTSNNNFFDGKDSIVEVAWGDTIIELYCTQEMVVSSFCEILVHHDQQPIY